LRWNCQNNQRGKIQDIRIVFGNEPSFSFGFQFEPRLDSRRNSQPCFFGSI